MGRMQINVFGLEDLDLQFYFLRFSEVFGKMYVINLRDTSVCRG